MGSSSGAGTTSGLIRSPAEIETLAAGVPDNGGCYLVPAFSGLFAPYWDNAAQGILVGLTSFVTKAHIARAVLEATAWQTRDVVDAMNADAGMPALSLAVDGGMTGDNLLMQLVADVLDIPVVRPMMAETVALGAAYAAGLAVGYWPDRQVLRRHWQRAGEWRPRSDPQRRDGGTGQWRHAVSLARAWGNARGAAVTTRPRHPNRRVQHVVPSGGIEPPASPKLDCRAHKARRLSAVEPPSHPGPATS